MSEARGDFRLDPGEIDRFWDQGYLGPFTLCSPQEAGALWERVQGEVLTSPGPCLRDENGEPDHFCGRHLDSPLVRRLATRPALVERVLSLYGTGALLFLTRFWSKTHGSPELPWHQDSTYWPIYPKVAVTSWLALTPAQRDNGCVEVIPGSHLRPYPQAPAGESMLFELTAVVPEEDCRRAVSLELRPGQFYLFDVNTLHRSRANRSHEPRVGLQASFAPLFVRVPADWFFEGHLNLVVGEPPPGWIPAARAVALAGEEDRGESR